MVKTRRDVLLTLITEIEKSIASKEGIFMIAIDGDCGSGKTTLAKELAQEFSAVSCHIDDFYLPRKLRTAARLSQPGGNIHSERILEMFETLKQTNKLYYAPYNPLRDEIEKARELPLTKVVIVEGSYSLLPALTPFYDYQLILTATEVDQRERLLEREGETKYQEFLKMWIPKEKYFQEYYQIAAKATKVIKSELLKYD